MDLGSFPKGRRSRFRSSTKKSPIGRDCCHIRRGLLHVHQPAERYALNSDVVGTICFGVLGLDQLSWAMASLPAS